ncbi:MAG: outer membrane protein assembly factor BamD [Flavobacteriaceae bacterium]|nr:outer membrane protein assembly factor BamD [Flavobacteriaceae bacterium]
MRNFFYILILMLVTTGCSQYQKALKSEDLAFKSKLAEELYNAKKYKKSIRLYEQIEPKYRGRPQGERILYFYATNLYFLKDYITSGYQLERFTSAYPRSEKVEEVALMGAKSYYHLSPKYSLDQTDTQTALDKLQNFINSYPKSEKLDEANALYQELAGKLERKAFEVAKQYNKIYDYQAALKSLDLFLSEYPGSSFREEALYYRVLASFNYAENSIQIRQIDRYKDVLAAYNKLVDSFKESIYIGQLKTMVNKSKAQIERLTLLANNASNNP